MPRIPSSRVPGNTRRVGLGLALVACAAAVSIAGAIAVPATLGAAPRPDKAPEAQGALCTCATAPFTNGWCEKHQVGWVASIKMKSKLLWEQLDAHGHTLDLTTFTCPTCRKAIETDGYCEADRIGFVGKLAYFSRLTYEQAKGRKIDPAKLTCRVCRRNAQSHGWCYKDKVGMVENVAIDDWEAWQRLEKAIALVELANARSTVCETCAVAMVTDGLCPYCRITYKDGKAVSSGAGAAQAIHVSK